MASKLLVIKMSVRPNVTYAHTKDNILIISGI